MVGFYGFANGNPQLLTFPIDSNGNQCGLPDSDLESFPYLYYPFPIPGYFKYRVCVNECPNSRQFEIQCYKTELYKTCSFRFEDYSDSPSIYGYIKGVYSSHSFLDRFCLPEMSNMGWIYKNYDEAREIIDTGVLSKWFSDVIET